MIKLRQFYKIIICAGKNVVKQSSALILKIHYQPIHTLSYI